jgi:uncharacterized membrane protein YoaK (UPF0700 family)
MPTSLFLAKLIGPLFLAVGVGLIANAAVYRKFAEEALASLALIYLTGLLTMTAGLAIVLSHNVWAADWRVLITLLGWIAVIGGAVRIVMPQGTQKFGRRFLKHPQGMIIAAAIWLAIGAVLCFFGYFR